MLFIYENNGWWELDKDKLTVYNYMGGHHSISETELLNAKIFECNSWHELYLAKHFCPFESDIGSCSGWLSPDGKIYESTAHEVTAEYLCDIIYGIESLWPGDELEKRCWVRITTTLMWDVRFEEWENKNLTQKQLDTLWDWCDCHHMKYPYNKED